MNSHSPENFHSLRSRVKGATRHIHELLDQDPLALRLMSSDFTTGDYLRFLSRTLGFIEPIEELLHSKSVTELATPRWMPTVKRAPLIKSDLESMGMTRRDIDALPKMPELPIVETTGHLMGVSYVVEGSMMGGLVMAKQVAKHLSLDRTRMSFFLPDEPKTVVAGFERFVQAFDSFARCSCDEEEALDAASKTFELIWRWFNIGS